MKRILSWSGVFLMVVLSVSGCDKNKNNSDWVTIDHDNVEACWGVQLGAIDYDNSYLDFDDVNPLLSIVISDFNDRYINFEDVNWWTNETNYEFADFDDQYDYDAEGVVLRVDTSYRGWMGTADVYCLTRSSELYIGTAEFFSEE